MLSPYDLVEIGQRAYESHQSLLMNISAAKEVLGMGYDSIMKMPLKDFVDILKIRSEEEQRKAEMLKQQQKTGLKDVSKSTQSKKRGPFFTVMDD